MKPHARGSGRTKEKSLVEGIRRTTTASASETGNNSRDVPRSSDLDPAVPIKPSVLLLSEFKGVVPLVGQGVDSDERWSDRWSPRSRKASGRGHDCVRVAGHDAFCSIESDDAFAMCVCNLRDTVQ